MSAAFHIVDRLGQGGHGAVYLASMLGEHGVTRDVAVKVLRSPNEDADTEERAALQEMMAARLRDEARIMGQLDHPAIARVITMTYLEGAPSVIMEYVRGRPVAGLHLPPRAALELVGQVASALRYAHAAGVWHRDIKPDNVVLTTEGAVKVLDFGIAKVQSEARESRTQTGVILGTARYMAPELFHGDMGPAVDVYALGAMMYELLTGRRWKGTCGLSLDAARDRVCDQISHVDDETLQHLLWGMVNPTAGERYTAQVVEDWCHDNAVHFDGDSLRRLSRDTVTPLRVGANDPTDPFLGRTLSGSPTPTPARTEPVIHVREGYPEDYQGLEEAFQRAAWELGLSGTLVAMHRGPSWGHIVADVPSRGIFLELTSHDGSCMPGTIWDAPPRYHLRAGPLLGDGPSTLSVTWKEGERTLASALREAVEHWACREIPALPLHGRSKIQENYRLLAPRRGYAFGPKEHR